MSVPERTIRFTPAARRDLRSIALYTRRFWGNDQHQSYRAAIDQAFRMLREHPQIGRPRDDRFPGCRSIQVEQHVIYYYQSETEIVVVRILHHRQDASAAVNDPRS